MTRDGIPRRLSGRETSAYLRCCHGYRSPPVVVLDCPDPKTLAEFYGALLDWEVKQGDSDWWFVRAEYGGSIGFQKVDGFTAPRWPGQRCPSRCTSMSTSTTSMLREAAVLELGATKHEHQPGTTFRVFLDPAGHPFCLCQG